MQQSAELSPHLEVTNILNIEITHMFHLSDVHISRDVLLKGSKAKFLSIFAEVYKEIKIVKNNPSIKLGIIITGDLLDTKNGLSMDSIEVLRDFLYNLSELCPTFVIAGNHDVSERGGDEVCGIRPLAKLTHYNLHYFEWTGLYSVGNLIFVVSSLKDGKFIRFKDLPPEVAKKPEDLVYLYHGFISESKQVPSTTRSSRFRSKEDFIGFPNVLLGDIHEHKVIRPGMAYAGSLLQVNCSEPIDGHGMLFWDLKKKTCKFIEIKNDHGFVKIRVDNGIMNETDVKNITIQNPTIICELNQTTNSQYSKIKEQLGKQQLGKQHVSMDAEHSGEQNTSHQSSLSTMSFDTFEIYEKRQYKSNVINLPSKGALNDKPISLEDEMEAITKHSKMIGDDLEEIISIHKTISETVNKPEECCYFSWDLLSIKFKNIFSYGNDVVNFIDFKGNPNELESKIINISGPNRWGKSSLCNMILFALFDRTNDSHNRNSDILNKCARSGFIYLKFQCKGQIYLICKKCRKSHDPGEEIQETDFYKLDLKKTKWVSMSQMNQKETKKLLQDYVGTIDNFLQNNTLISKLSRSILDERPAEQFRSLNQLFQFDCYIKHIDTSKVSSSGIKKKINLVKPELEFLKTRPEHDGR